MFSFCLDGAIDMGGRLPPLRGSFRSVSPAATLGTNEASLRDGASSRPLLASGFGDGQSDLVDGDNLPFYEDTNTGTLLGEGAGDREIDNLGPDGSRHDYENLV